MNSENPGSQPKEQFRVVINRESNEAIERFLVSVNDDGNSTKVTKSDLANFLFERLNEILTDADIAEIRRRFFDAKKALEGILKNGEDLPAHLREAVLKHCGINPTTKEKRPKKVSTPKLVDNNSAIA